METNLGTLDMTNVLNFETVNLVKIKKALSEYGVRFDSFIAKPEENDKILKSLTVSNVYTSILHLAPADEAGEVMVGKRKVKINMCPMAINCKALCLNWAGNPAYMSAKLKSRINKTRLLFTNRELFMWTFYLNVAREAINLGKRGEEYAVRPNGTSDHRWEVEPITVTTALSKLMLSVYDSVIKPGTYPNIMVALQKTKHNEIGGLKVTWYDYTKLPVAKRMNEIKKHRGVKYHLTYSLDGDANTKHAIDALKLGVNLAVPFATKRSKALPTKFTIGGKTLKVINGDLTDYRPGDKKNVVVGLRYKVTKVRNVKSHVGNGFIQSID